MHHTINKPSVSYTESLQGKSDLFPTTAQRGAWVWLCLYLVCPSVFLPVTCGFICIQHLLEKPECRFKCLCVRARTLNKGRLGKVTVIFLSWSLPLLSCSNHWRGKTARTAPSTASPATGACTRHPQVTARRCSPSTHLQTPLLRIRPTALGRKNQILLKSGPSPGACMKTDVSNSLNSCSPRPSPML